MVVQLRIKIYTKYVMIILRKTCLFLSSTSNFFKLMMYIMKHRKYMCCNAMIAFTSCNQYFYQVFAFELLVYNTAWIQDSPWSFSCGPNIKRTGQMTEVPWTTMHIFKRIYTFEFKCRSRIQMLLKNYRLKIW